MMGWDGMGWVRWWLGFKERKKRGKEEERVVTSQFNCIAYVCFSCVDLLSLSVSLCRKVQSLPRRALDKIGNLNDHTLKGERKGRGGWGTARVKQPSEGSKRCTLGSLPARAIPRGEIPNTNSYAAKVCKKSVLPTKTNALLKCRVQPTGHSAYMDTWGPNFPHRTAVFLLCNG